MLAAIAMAILDGIIAAFSIPIIGIAMLAVLIWFLMPADIHIIELGSFKLIVEEIKNNPMFILDVIINYILVMNISYWIRDCWIVGNQQSCL